MCDVYSWEFRGQYIYFPVMFWGRLASVPATGFCKNYANGTGRDGLSEAKLWGLLLL